MITRGDIVLRALTQDGYDNGAGYDGPNKYSEQLGRPSAEAWCADFVTWVYEKEGLGLPAMQAGCHTGFAYVPAGWAYAQAHDATGYSWESQPGDLVIFGFGSQVPQHVEMATSWTTGRLYTIGGNSNGSNMPGNPYHGDGGVHRHMWVAPLNEGNDQIIGIIKTGKLVTF